MGGSGAAAVTVATAAAAAAAAAAEAAVTAAAAVAVAAAVLPVWCTDGSCKRSVSPFEVGSRGEGQRSWNVPKAIAHAM